MMESESRHRRLHKSHTLQSPAWKATYRKRCQERLRQSRDKFLERLRTIQPQDGSTADRVEEVMSQEWQQLCSEDSSLPLLPHDDVDQMTSIMEMIRQELLNEEELILAEYDAAIQFEEATLTSAISSEGRGHMDKLLCPICQRCPLMQNKGVIFCSCGVRIDTEQDCITLESIGRNLVEGVESHQANCQTRPHFSVMKQLGVDNMLMTCEKCDFMFIIV